MRRSSPNKGVGYDEQYTREDQVMATSLMIIFVLALAILAFMAGKNNLIVTKSSQLWPYQVREIDLGRFEGNPDTEVQNDFDPSSTIILKMNNGTEIVTDLSSEDIINQLSLDYADLYDYYGGAEELY